MSVIIIPSSPIRERGHIGFPIVVCLFFRKSFLIILMGVSVGVIYFCDVKNSVMYGEFTSTVSFCLLVTHCHDLQSAIKIIKIGNSDLLIGCISFHTFACTSNTCYC